jgi:mono/diheme cytochrome c family protein
MRTRTIFALFSVAAIGVVALVGLHNSRWGWRIDIVLEKVSGGLDEVAWSELALILNPWGPYKAQALSRSRSAYASIRNPYIGPDHLQAGSELFARHCARCHSGPGEGEAGPRFEGYRFRRGDSDWALRGSIKNGIAGTAMPGFGHQLDDIALWQLVAHVRRVHDDVAIVERETREVPPISFERLLEAESHSSDWLGYTGGYSGQRYSRLDQISRDNIDALRLARAMGCSFSPSRPTSCTRSMPAPGRRYGPTHRSSQGGCCSAAGA